MKYGVYVFMFFFGINSFGASMKELIVLDNVSFFESPIKNYKKIGELNKFETVFFENCIENNRAKIAKGSDKNLVGWILNSDVNIYDDKFVSNSKLKFITFFHPKKDVPLEIDRVESTAIDGWVEYENKMFFYNYAIISTMIVGDIESYKKNCIEIEKKDVLINYRNLEIIYGESDYPTFACVVTFEKDKNLYVFCVVSENENISKEEKKRLKKIAFSVFENELTFKQQ